MHLAVVCHNLHFCSAISGGPERCFEFLGEGLLHLGVGFKIHFNRNLDMSGPGEMMKHHGSSMRFGEFHCFGFGSEQMLTQIRILISQKDNPGSFF